MSLFDLTAFAVTLAAETKAHVRQAISAAMTDVDVRLKAIDTLAHARGDAGPPGVAGPAGRDGKDADVVQVKAEIAAAMQAISGDLSAMMRDLVREEVGRQMAGVQMPRDGRDGKDVDLLAVKALVDAAVVTAVEPRPDVAGLVAAEVTKAIATWPRPTDGRDGETPDLEVLARKAASLVPVPRDGRDGTAGKDAEAPDLDAIARKAASLIPAPKDGRDGKDADSLAVAALERDVAALKAHVETMPTLIASSVTKVLDAIAKPRDGVGLVDAFIDREDRLILTLSDGATKDVGHVVGKSVDLAAARVELVGLVERELATWERPKDGANGIDGKDGLGFDDLSFGFTEQQGLLLRFARGEQVKESPLPVPWYAGVWQYGRVYPIAAMTTVKGAMWIAERHAPGRPGDPDSGWRLCVKAGQDGKPGPPGRDGHGE